MPAPVHRRRRLVTTAGARAGPDVSPRRRGRFPVSPPAAFISPIKPQWPAVGRIPDQVSDTTWRFMGLAGIAIAERAGAASPRCFLRGAGSGASPSRRRQASSRPRSSRDLQNRQVRAGHHPAPLRPAGLTRPAAAARARVRPASPRALHASPVRAPPSARTDGASSVSNARPARRGGPPKPGGHLPDRASGPGRVSSARLRRTPPGCRGAPDEGLRAARSVKGAGARSNEYFHECQSLFGY